MADDSWWKFQELFYLFESCRICLDTAPLRFCRANYINATQLRRQVCSTYIYNMFMSSAAFWWVQFDVAKNENVVGWCLCFVQCNLYSTVILFYYSLMNDVMQRSATRVSYVYWLYAIIYVVIYLCDIPVIIDVSFFLVLFQYDSFLICPCVTWGLLCWRLHSYSIRLLACRMRTALPGRLWNNRL